MPVQNFIWGGIVYKGITERERCLIQIVSVGMSFAKENRQAAVFIAYIFFC